MVCLLLTVGACAMPPLPPPPPPPPPPPAPTPPPPYLVFFDWNSAVVGPSGREVIAPAAQAYKAGSPVTVQVTGFTDTSGSADYNVRAAGQRRSRRAGARRGAAELDGGYRARPERPARTDAGRCPRAAKPPSRDRRGRPSTDVDAIADRMKRAPAAPFFMPSVPVRPAKSPRMQGGGFFPNYGLRCESAGSSRCGWANEDRLRCKREPRRA